MNPICMRPANYNAFPDNAYKHMQEIGIKYLERPRADDMDEEIKKLADHDLSVYSVQANFPVWQADCLEYMKKDIEAAKQFDSKQMFVSANNKEEDFDLCCERLHQAGDLVADAGLKIVLETHPPFVKDAAIGVSSIEKINHPKVRINWDTANIHYYNKDVDGVEELKKIIQYVESVHVKDSNQGFEEWCFPALGEGTVKFPELFALLNEANYNGPYIMEIEGIKGEEIDEAGLHERLRISTEYLNQQLAAFA